MQKKEWVLGFFLKENICFLKIFFSSSSTLKYPQLPGMERVSTCKYYYIAYYIGYNPSTSCKHLHGPCTPLPTPWLFLRDVLWPLRTYALCQDGSSTVRKAAWLRILFIEPETPRFLLLCSRTTIVPGQNLSDGYFGLKSNYFDF